MRPTQPPTQWVQATLQPRVKQPEREADHYRLDVFVEPAAYNVPSASASIQNSF
jgi:hypothetical protein